MSIKDEFCCFYNDGGGLSWSAVPSTLTGDHLTIKIRTQQSEVENVMCETGAAALKHEISKHKNNVLFAIDGQFYSQNPPLRFDTFGDI